MNPSSNDKKRNLPAYADEDDYDVSCAGAAANVAEAPSANVVTANVASVNVAAVNLPTANTAPLNAAPPNAASAVTMHNPYFYPGAIIPQFPFNTPMYQQPMGYGHMMPYCDYGYVNKRSTKKKKNYHHYSRQQNSGLSILKEALVDPWAQQYAKYPNIIFD
ncbi:conserved Plasmodium protein, unknown function [Plasmodium vivax]|uniref:Uncharacterized protein n=6 Tax=Plasmodium vivax TaxID=5855 RepID=A5KAB8_PLAVS|nr:hypothetical protein, conserved [Plasmodium vivax]KMZ83069.1 hypothetical protein PVIIG_05530 [Plasmodium vivax India VII]KMZ89500.1 hypothetical protein PVBG_03221 [Plasmodium vivax Brazil I]KMZ95861.1 hypothetical protein PVMG_03935 [Plasmodium vivax Mauritania I]KNA02475.1 hypothetical protein PVNG_03768 [Plasmodium vivax North Korean]EDL43754.1 hypothetical protein, conserved [Plasmodium vivax]|eukprot:XP_001613481.1 hypothetical protein [Plasmodium vivax Sal-1]